MHDKTRSTYVIPAVPMDVLLFSLIGEVMVIMINATFNNISAISWRTISLVEETGVPGKNRWPAASIWQSWIEYTAPWEGFELTTSVVIGTDYIGSCKPNYHTITTTKTPCLTSSIV